MNMPSPADIQCTQNAGHGVVIPSDSGGRAGSRAAGTTPRTTGPEVLVADGDAMPIMKAGGKDAHIPQEFWQNSVQLQWHDPRNELSRLKQFGTDRENKCAQELKLQELSSEIFGTARRTAVSTKAPGSELMSVEVDQFQTDSALNPVTRQSRNGPTEAPVDTAFSRLTRNLADSNENTMTRQSRPDAAEQPRLSQEDPQNMGRRRQEKNFSDLFGTSMPQRREINREEVTGTRTCSFLDTRAEIAARNKEKWRPGLCEVSGGEMREVDCVPQRRKEAENSSKLYEYDPPARPRQGTAEIKVSGAERICWDTRDIMEASSELARRTRLKEYSQEQNAKNRKQENLNSQQAAMGFGAEGGAGQFNYSPRTSEAQAPAAGGRPATAQERPKTAKDTKLAFLQSSIFG